MSSVRYSEAENDMLVQLWMSGATEAEMIEVKQGPYAGESDKTRFGPVSKEKRVIGEQD